MPDEPVFDERAKRFAMDAEHEKHEREVADKMKEIEKKIEDAVNAPVQSRPVATIVPRAPMDHVRLRCESILQMAFQVWMEQVRGPSPFVGPQDMFRLNEMKRLLFSINAENNDFPKK